MGLKFTAKCLPKYFERLQEYGMDFRQFDEITFVNTETEEEKTFEIGWIGELDNSKQKIIKSLTPEIPWDDERSIWAIDLGAMVKNNHIPKIRPKR